MPSTDSFRAPTMLAITVVFLSLWAPAGRAAEDCQQARAYVRQAVHGEHQPGDLTAIMEKERLYREAIALCPSFPEVHNNLGDVYENLGRYAEAIAAYKRAVELRSDYARAYYGLGDIYFKSGHYREAIKWYEAGLTHDLHKSQDQESARDLLAQAQTLLRTKRLHGKAVLGKEDIVVVLSQLIERGSDAPVKITFGLDENMGLIPFDTNRSDIREDAKIQLDELGKALASPALSAYAFELRGYADDRGSDTHNVELSRKRAAAVKHYLEQQFHIPAERLTVKGYGKARLLAPGMDEASHAINRRVEVVRVGRDSGVETPQLVQALHFLYQEGSTGPWLPIRADGTTVLRTGQDQHRIFFRLQQTSYVYLLQQAPDGKWAVLLPREQSFANPVQPGKDYWVPRFDKGFPLDATKGIETIYFLASLQQVPELESPGEEQVRGSAGIGPLPGVAPDYHTIMRNFGGFLATITFLHE